MKEIKTIVQLAIDQATACFSPHNRPTEWAAVFEMVINAQLRYEELLLKEQEILQSTTLQELRAILIDIQSKQQ
jgi:hypothetical protein